MATDSLPPLSAAARLPLALTLLAGCSLALAQLSVAPALLEGVGLLLGLCTLTALLAALLRTQCARSVAAACLVVTLAPLPLAAAAALPPFLGLGLHALLLGLAAALTPRSALTSLGLVLAGGATFALLLSLLLAPLLPPLALLGLATTAGLECWAGVALLLAALARALSRGSSALC